MGEEGTAVVQASPISARKYIIFERVGVIKDQYPVQHITDLSKSTLTWMSTCTHKNLILHKCAEHRDTEIGIPFTMFAI